MEWTGKQRQAIEIRDKNVLVSAAAGSGKTAVLTERIRRLVTDDRVPLSRMLVVTFTEKAASEMRGRIAKALEDALPASGRDDFLEEQLQRISAAKIQTFHAFALSVVKQHFHVIGLDPSFRPADAQRAAILKEEALDALLEEFFEAEDAAFLAFCGAYAGVKDERAVREMVLELYEFIRNLPEPFAWLEGAVAALEAGRLPEMEEGIGYEIRLAQEMLARVSAWLAAEGFPRLHAKSLEDGAQAQEILDAFERGDFDRVRACIGAFSLTRFMPSKEEKESGWDDVKELVALRRAAARDLLKELPARFFAKDAAAYGEEISQTAPYARTLEVLTRRFHELYTEVKRREGVIDFSDFEHMALDILADDAVAESYRDNLCAIFVDEYQDSSPVQEALIERLRRPVGVFFVGDVKQSIYSFRNAEPRLFLEKYEAYTHDEAAYDRADDVCIDLSQNFRSKRGVVDAVNAVFAHAMERHGSGMEYDDKAALVLGVENEAKWDVKPVLHLVEKDRAKEAFASEAEGEADRAARIILETVGQPFFDTKAGRERPLEYRDVVILLRDAKSDAETFRRVLEDNGIPAYTDRGAGYFETVEIDTFLGLLRAIDNMRQDVPLAACLCSPVFGFTVEELARVREGGGEGAFYAAFLRYSEGGPDDGLRGRCVAAIRQIERWRGEERFMRLDDFLWKLMRESGFYDHAGAQLHGAQRQANLRALLDLAADYQAGRVRGLYGFLRHLEDMRLKTEVAQVRLASEQEDLVRILTIHASKGLEFPVVIACRLGRAFGGGRHDGKLLLHRDVGLALEWEDPAAHMYRRTLLQEVLRQRKGLDERAESIRLLYVAMTRAMDRLHLVGTVSGVKEASGVERAFGLYEGAGAFLDLDVRAAGSFLRVLLPVVFASKGVFEVKGDVGDVRGGSGRRGQALAMRWSSSRTISGGSSPKTRNSLATEASGMGEGEELPVDSTRMAAAAQTVGFFNGEEPREIVAAPQNTHGEGLASPATAAADIARGGVGVGDEGDGGIASLASAVASLGLGDGSLASPAPVYRFAGASGVRSKYSVSQVAQALRGGDGVCDVRFFVSGSVLESAEDAGWPDAVGGDLDAGSGGGLTAAERGTALHRALELMDFREAFARRSEAGWFASFLSGLLERGVLSEEEARAVGAGALHRFANAPLCARAAEARLCLKELPFNMKMRFGEAFPREAGAAGAADEEIIVQGVIDCLLRDAQGKLVIADYKSGHFDPGGGEREAARVRETYGAQVGLYRRAAELVYGEPVCEAYVYMTRTGTAIAV
ncbi:MAG: helicase-exonuclease AddAB subunit AddA [Clostridiales Family XIII bacterium]|jgi:ATP-dependent helicase/nuclease subunit A|nr:helicase-exonuclease AddAB subunit AddA [Clostridiales Family XIII bacterium]